MKKIIVYEQVKTRRYDLVKGYGDWKNFDGTFEECCQSIEDNYDSNKYIFLSIQVAKFYYDENGQYIAWNIGRVFTNGKWEHED